MANTTIELRPTEEQKKSGLEAPQLSDLKEKSENNVLPHDPSSLFRRLDR